MEVARVWRMWRIGVSGWPPMPPLLVQAVVCAESFGWTGRTHKPRVTRSIRVTATNKFLDLSLGCFVTAGPLSRFQSRFQLILPRAVRPSPASRSALQQSGSLPR